MRYWALAGVELQNRLALTIAATFSTKANQCWGCFTTGVLGTYVFATGVLGTRCTTDTLVSLLARSNMWSRLTDNQRCCGNL